MANKDLIISLPDKHLRTKSRKIGVISDEIRQTIADMKSATLDWEATREHEVGVALAAIQIDQPCRIVIIRNNFEDKADKTFSAFINPQIIKLEGELEEDYEGCLSVPDVYGKVPRYNKARLRAIDETGNEVRIKAEGFLARVLQHEIDHTNGVMFVDHIKDQLDAFYRLSESGKLISVPYDQIRDSGIFR